ncbi:MAG TPA: MerR family transcriptional regulator [bacterium]|nr:MerR family transcriptional regulator [bacterium]
MQQLSLFSLEEKEFDPQVKKGMEDKAIKRLYYSIAEVSQITGLKPYVLRFWETEFPELKPAKNSAGNRIYRKADIKTVFMIKRLLYNDKYTIDGARQRLKQLKNENDPQLNLFFKEVKQDELLNEIYLGLQEMLEILNKFDRGVAQSG